MVRLFCKRNTIVIAFFFLLAACEHKYPLHESKESNYGAAVLADTVNLSLSLSNKPDTCENCDSLLFKIFPFIIDRGWISINYPNIDSVSFILLENKEDDFLNGTYYSDTVIGFFAPVSIKNHTVIDSHLQYFVSYGIGYGGVSEERIIFVFKQGNTVKAASITFDFLIDKIDAFLAGKNTYAFIVKYYEKFGNTVTTINEKLVVVDNGIITLDTIFYEKGLNIVSIEQNVK